MEDKGKPLRTPSDASRDLYETYKINDTGVAKNKMEREINIDDGKNSEIIIEENKTENTSKEEASVMTEETPKNNDLLEELQISLEEARQERDEAIDQAKRLAAELDNFRRRSIREKQELIDYANERLLFKMLTLIDDFDAALKAANNSRDFDALMKGIELISQNAAKLMFESNVTEMDDPVGKQFDVNLHEAMMMMPSELPEGTVTQVVQKGYMIKDKVLRHAKVITSSGPDK